MSILEKFKFGFKLLPGEIDKFKQEVRDKFNDDWIYIFPGDMNKWQTFDSDESFKEWLVGADSDHQEGYSKCSLKLSQSGHALFSGILNTEVPNDGYLTAAGYCCLKRVDASKSFLRDSYYDFSSYSHIVIRLRGDGRTYMFNLHQKGYYDITWDDLYSFPMHTRGGPHWQLFKVPFSKFFMSSKGRVQDKQLPVRQNLITSVNILLADKIDGPFRLEIDYIGLLFDMSVPEEFAYENYEFPVGYIDM